MEKLLVNLAGLATRVKLPRDWLRAEAVAGRIPCLKVKRKLLFSPIAVEKVLAERAANTMEALPCA